MALGQSKLGDPVVRRTVVQWNPWEDGEGGELQHRHKTSPVAQRRCLLGGLGRQRATGGYGRAEVDIA